MKVPFGDILNSIMDEKGITASQVAADTDISKSTLSKLLNNLRNPSYETIIQLADYLKVSTDRLFGRSKSKKSK